MQISLEYECKYFVAIYQEDIQENHPTSYSIDESANRLDFLSCLLRDEDTTGGDTVLCGSVDKVKMALQLNHR